MRQSKLFTKTRKEAPSDEQAKNAQLLIRAGYVHKEMGGVYSYLPLGLRTLNKISKIVREEMDNIGAQEVLMPALQIKERYEATNRWSDEVVDNWFKTKLANGTEVGLGFSHEENLSPLLKNYISSYRDLPLAAYQIQTKFRNELRSKSGLMRGREFLMKDMYSFALNQEQHDEFYEESRRAYHRVYDRLGIGENTFFTFASGGVFSKFSHEFQTLSEAGEDTIYLDREKGVAINKEVYTDEVIKETGVDPKELEEVRSIEVGNIFSLGTKFSTPFELSVTTPGGEKVDLIMGCYGIGVSRVMGTIAELMSDEKGLVWPESVAPFDIHLILVQPKDQKQKEKAEKLYTELKAAGVEVLFDDRETSAGEKFADADLIGIPHRLIIGKRSLETGSIEYVERKSGETKELHEKDILEFFKK